VSSILSSIGGGGVGGAIVMAIVGLINLRCPSRSERMAGTRIEA
jgi:hypothetical protein